MRKTGKMTVAVIFGGVSPEHGVSESSALAVLGALSRERYDVIEIGITAEGDWYRYDGPPEAIPGGGWERDREALTPVTVDLSRSRRGLLELRGGCCTPVPVDAVLPVLHGRNGEDGTVQGLFTLAGIPVAGCGVLASALCMDKARAHAVVREAGIPVPASVTFPADRLEDGAARVLRELAFPVYAKPLRAGSSFGITRVEGPGGLESALELAAKYDSELTVEEEIPGFEVGCAIVGAGEALTLGRVDEVEVPGGFFDYGRKYGDGARVHMPARVDAGTEGRIRDTAAGIYRALGCSGFARVDMFLTPDGRVVFNEVNTIPGFTAHSRFPRMMEGAGIGMAAVLDMILESADNGRY